ncbi:MAG: FAD-dependent oxidoreductase [Lachnospiraceae bacterium]|nr:FAD-dependent oxidoreductase [Lachnospiraceae bacterium]
MQSLWESEVVLPSFAPLSGETKTDVLIIGGGLAGILCAYFLQKAGVDYCLAEAEEVGGGVTGRTTAKITAQHGLLYHKVEQRYGLAAAGGYLRMNQLALEQYRALCKEMSCDFEEKDNYVYSTEDRNKLEWEMKVLDYIGADAVFREELPLPFSTCGAVMFPKQAQFQPLKFLAGIARGLRIYEHTKVLEFQGKTVVTNRGKIRADKIIVATHFPMLNKHGMYFMKLYQHRSYVVALKHATKLNGMYVDENKKGFSFRSAGDLLLLGGGAHRTGKQGGGYTELRQTAALYYPRATEAAHWATQDCMSLDSIPYIGPYSKRTEGVYVATGFNKWGMTSSMVAAMLLSDMVLEKKNEYASLFSPSRTMLRGQLFVNLAESAAGLVSFSRKRCPHLGCALKWNGAEHSWDCPCHGSRFGSDGQLLNNPANRGLK